MYPYTFRLSREPEWAGKASSTAFSLSENRPPSGLSACCLLLILGLICLNNTGCGSSSATKSSPGLTTRSPIETERKYDAPPLSDRELSGMLDEHTVPIATPGVTQKPDSTPVQEVPEAPTLTGTDRNPVPPPSPDSHPPGKTVVGYRVQVHSFHGRTAAIKAHKEVKMRVKELLVKVHLEKESSYYKIRVGDFTSKSDADRLARILKTRKGYPDAWVVKTSVYASGR